VREINKEATEQVNTISGTQFFTQKNEHDERNTYIKDKNKTRRTV
jgi:hypothetical protein